MYVCILSVSQFSRHIKHQSLNNSKKCNKDYAVLKLHNYLLMKLKLKLMNIVLYLEPQAVAVSPYGWLMTHYGWLAGLSRLAVVSSAAA